MNGMVCEDIECITDNGLIRRQRSHDICVNIKTQESREDCSENQDKNGCEEAIIKQFVLFLFPHFYHQRKQAHDDQSMGHDNEELMLLIYLVHALDKS